MDNKYYHIEDVAIKTGLTKRAIRYYEDVELIKPIRTDSSYRLYTDEDIDKIIRIKSFRDTLGFSLSEVKSVFDLEADLKSIFNGEREDAALVESSMELIQKQIKLINEKSETLEKVKARYKEVLVKLEALNHTK